MENDYFICNYKKCRKPLKESAWVTSCSHVFCEEDGTREFSKALVCPACEADLPEKCDLVKQNMNPNEKFKSIVLAGYSPDTVMEICTRAILFWVYQSQQQISYKEEVIGSMTEKYSHLERNYEQAVVKSKSESDILKSKIQALQQEKEDNKAKVNEIMEKLADKNRQLQKTKILYENLRRHCNSPVFYDKNVSQLQKQRLAQTHELPLATFDDVVFQTKEAQAPNAEPTDQNARQPMATRSQIPQREPVIVADANRQAKRHSTEEQFMFEFASPSKRPSFNFNN